ncbi:Axonemal dynein light chain domain-containing protein 1 [Phytophthora pseudosyringae]|uniref:Axonemal dynein light chain domain-containing protein 1 n=1 Tax=Phytophthora pseudosyringae TaxID=221518 RepID=A0A8T1W3R8_9STRA|nr:Axonemal dynein light chain domain-containing protein 1 [Phytophthora pseudosyringae]
MLPPLTLGDSKGGFFLRKRVDGGGESTGSKQKSFKTIRPSPRASIHVPTPRTSRTNEGDDDFAASSSSTRPDLSEISMIPREFFVVETNAVLLPQDYPPNQFKSSLNAQGQWETVVFPALTPHNRQQVLYLRQTLDKMRATMPQFDGKSEGDGPEAETGAERRRLMIEYTSQETQIYSYCFHELARQIKCICKEQSELLHEIRERYDAAAARLIDQLKILGQQNNQQQDHVAELGAQLQHALDEKRQLAQRIEELEHQVKSGPPVAAAQEAFRLRKLKFRAKRLGRSEEELDKDLYDEKHSEDSESGIDEEETEWRRQRDAASVCRPSISSKHDSTKELNLAATRVQAAFQKYQARKEQTRVTIRVEKQAAAMDIQRSYRGFRDRQLALHRRAIMRTIMRRREENAAVELMQANVRSYLLNRRRSAKLKLSAMTTLKLPDDSDEVPETAPVPVVAEDPVPATEEVAPAPENNDENVTKGDLQAGKESEGGAKPNPRQALMRLLTTFRELASVISTFHRGEDQSVKSEDTLTAVESAGSYEDPRVLPPRPLSAAPSELFDDEDVELFQQTMQEAQALVGSLHVVLGTVAEEKSESDDGELSSDGSDSDLDSDDAAQLDSLDDLARQAQSDRDESNTEAQLADADSKYDANAFDVFDDNALNIPFGERDAMRLQNYAELHLDDSLWSSATYYPASREDMAEAEALLALALASREQRKRLVSLKQFISDMYDTIVGKLTELPPRRLAEMLASRCHLALSFSEWREQRAQLFSRAVGADQPGEQAAIPALTFSIEQLTREHFRCRLGLPQLIDAAVASLVESVEDFAAIDPDVKRFHEFLSKERSEEELIFCCMCRYLCARRLTSDESPAGTAGSSSHRQPIFHPVTMREIIDVPHVLELAKVLFRVEDESAIVESDAPLTEVENSVYRQYLPTNGYHQFEAIVSSFFVDADSQAAAVSSITEGEDQTPASACRRPDGAPRRASAMLRPTNYNQFHAKQYNAQAARSPIVRHQQPSFPPPATVPRWVYLEEVLALLIKYRGEMNHFHLFSYWVQELFGLATSSAPATQRPGKWLDDTAFVETLAPLSLGPTERELRNIFHNSLRQRGLQAFMPVRVFTSVALLLLRNGLLSVSIYAPMQKTPGGGRRGGARQRSLSIREENEDKEWQALALKWRTQESQFEAAIEAIYHDPLSPVDGASSDKTRAAHALQLLQLRQELYDLFASRSGRGRDLRRALDIYGILVTERLARVGGDTRLLDAQLGASPSLGAWSTTTD